MNEENYSKRNPFMDDPAPGYDLVRRKIWNDRSFTEVWEMPFGLSNATLVYRHRSLNSYPWTYKAGNAEDFTKDWYVRVNKQLRPMSQEEVDCFKAIKRYK